MNSCGWESFGDSRAGEIWELCRQLLGSRILARFGIFVGFVDMSVLGIWDWGVRICLRFRDESLGLRE